MSSGRHDKRSIAKKKRTLSCENGVCNNGKNGICNDRKNEKEDDDWEFDVDSNSNNEGNSGDYDGRCLPDRPESKILPSQRQAMRLFSMAEPPEDRDHFKERFHTFETGKETSLCPLTGAGAMACITKHNKHLQLAKREGAARSNAGDYGTMHVIGTHVHFNGVTASTYKANETVDEALLRGMGVSLAEIGRCAFPQIYAVIRDTKGNCGLHPVVPMDVEGGWRVGYTVDMSVDLGSSSHYNFNDVSQGYSMWGEEIPGKGTNWYLLIPNIHDRCPVPKGPGSPLLALLS